jgi:hypothetical protein
MILVICVMDVIGVTKIISITRIIVQTVAPHGFRN